MNAEDCERFTSRSARSLYRGRLFRDAFDLAGAGPLAVRTAFARPPGIPRPGADFSIRTRRRRPLRQKSECGVSKRVFCFKTRPWETAPILAMRSRSDGRSATRSFTSTSVGVGVFFILRTSQYKTVFRWRGPWWLPNLRVKHHNQSAAQTYSLRESSDADEFGRRKSATDS